MPTLAITKRAAETITCKDDKIEYVRTNLRSEASIICWICWFGEMGDHVSQEFLYRSSWECKRREQQKRISGNYFDV